MSYIYTDGSWLCGECGKINRRDIVAVCPYCATRRLYGLTYHQARAVARKLNALEIENKGLSAMLDAATLHVARLHRKQLCSQLNWDEGR